MCGRFTLSANLDDLQGRFGFMARDLEYRPRYNIAPTQQIVTVTNDGTRRAQLMRWGLVPFWAKDLKIGNRMINAVGETLATKPAFRAAFKKRRCLVPTDGFYEWKKQDGGKQPYRITLKDEGIFAFAGLWELWKGEEEIESFTIIVMDANDFLRPIHDRMPVILEPADYDVWLDGEVQSVETLKGLLKPYSSEKMTAYSVSKRVNSPKNDDPECIEETTIA